jgi:hypothetical protein
LKRFGGLDFSEKEINGHSGCIGKPVPKKGSLFFRPIFTDKGMMRVFAWLCKEKNKIFVFKAYSMDVKTLEEIAEAYKRVRCH